MEILELSRLKYLIIAERNMSGRKTAETISFQLIKITGNQTTNTLEEALSLPGSVPRYCLPRWRRLSWRRLEPRKRRGFRTRHQRQEQPRKR